MRKVQKANVKELLLKSAEQKRMQKEEELRRRNEGRTVYHLALIVAVLGFVLYINTLNHGYALDDYSLIIENSSTRKGFEGLGEIFKTSYRYGYIFASDEIYRPLSKAMFAIEWGLAPNKPTLGHWINVLLYAITGFFLTLTLFKYFRSVALAFIIGILYIAHPVHTEVVANIKSRDEILAFLFSILTLFTWKKYMEHKKNVFVVLTAVFFFLALLSKESAITFLGVFVLVWYFFINGKSKEFVKPMIGVLISTIIFFIIRSTIVGNVVSVKPSVADNLLMAAPDAAHRFATAIYIMGLYIKMLFVPHPLVFDYSYNQIPVIGFSDWRFIVSFLVLVIALITAFARLKLKSKAPWAFGILFFLITISISSNIFITIGTSMAERLLYVPSLGFCIALAYLFTQLLKVKDGMQNVKQYFTVNWKSNVAIAIVLLLFSVKTIARNTVWDNNYSLYVNDVKLSPNSTRTHYYLGNYLIKDENLVGKTALEKDSILRKAIEELKRSLEIYPPFVDAWNQLGVLYDKMKNIEEAKRCYETALKYNPNEPTVHNNIGTILFETANYAEAAKAFRKATEINPNYVDAYNNLGSVLGMSKQYDEAINAFQRVIQLDPGNLNAHHYLGVTYQLMGNDLKANEWFSKEKELKRK